MELGGNPTLTLCGPFKANAQQYSDTGWLNTVAVRNNGSINQPINNLNGAYFYQDDALSDAGFSSCNLVPSAFTIQIMNPSALQTTTGILYIGRTKQTLSQLCGSGKHWQQLADELVSYSAPRLCSAGKLALRGVMCSAIPYNLSKLSDFCPRLIAANGVQTWSASAASPYTSDLEGFAPIFIYNPNAVQVQILVTVEWRTRFDPGNPAYAGHTYHPPASESTWSEVVNSMEWAGHGVEELAHQADVGRHPMRREWNDHNL